MLAQSDQENQVYISSDGLNFSPIPGPGTPYDPTYTKFLAIANSVMVSVGAYAWQSDILNNLIYVAPMN